MQAYFDLVNASAPHQITIENCHFNTTYPRWVDRPGGELACPMNLFRVSDDIKANWAAVLRNVHATIPFANAVHPMSGPGCWACELHLLPPALSCSSLLTWRWVCGTDPDMLEVGVTGQNDRSEGGLTAHEERAHFGLWAVVSSPLTLSFDLGNSTIMDRSWPIITNTDVLAVNQGFFGHPGTLLDQDKDSAGGAWQVWAKPQGDGAMAVLLVNTGGAAADLSLALSNYASTAGAGATVRDLWAQKTVGPRKGTMRFPAVASHDSVFLLLTPAVQ